MAVELVAQDLSNWIGAPVVEVRANMIIQKVIALASDLVDPLPDSTEGVILQIVTRNYVNIQGNTMETLGIQQVQRSVNGITLSDDEREAVLTAAGQGGGKAFSVDTAPDAGADIPQTYVPGAYGYPFLPGDGVTGLDPSWGFIL